MVRPRLSVIVLAVLWSSTVYGQSQEIEPLKSANPTTSASSDLAPLWQQVQIAGLIQMDYLRLQRSLDELGDGDRNVLNEDRFAIRRARLRLDRNWHYFGVTSTTEFFSEESGVRPIALEIHGQFPGRDTGQAPLLQFRAGLIPVPFGFESYEQSHGERFFGERTLFAHSLIPGRFDLGVSVGGHFSGVDWVIAAQNGEPGTFGGQDPNAAKDYAGRLRMQGNIVPALKAAFAGSVLYGTGFSAGTGPTKDRFEWQDLNEDGRVLPSELIPVPGSAGRASQNFSRWAVGSDLQLWTEIPKVGALMVYSEVALAVNLDRVVAPADPVLLGRNQRSLGWYVGAVQEIVDRIRVGVRFEQYRPNADVLALFGGKTVVTRQRFRTLNAGVAGYWRLHQGDAYVRLLAEYEWQDNSLGRDARGLPAKLDNNTFRARLELRF